jgi:hypothetical protein
MLTTMEMIRSTLTETPCLFSACLNPGPPILLGSEGADSLLKRGSTTSVLAISTGIARHAERSEAKMIELLTMA